VLTSRRLDKTVSLNRPNNLLGPLDYIFLVFAFILARIIMTKMVIINLPLETQYPYLFNQFWKGDDFIKFAEKLKKIFNLKVFWQNSRPEMLNKFGISNLSITWNYLPKNIDLMINTDNLKKNFARSYSTRKELEKISHEFGKQIKIIFPSNNIGRHLAI